jgi:3-hydroxybutyryl-CoA dehydrogenase
MKVLVIGEDLLFDELREKLGNSHDYVHIISSEVLESIEEVDLAVDFTCDESPENLAILTERVIARIYLVNVVKSSLAENIFYLGELPGNIIGFNGLPGFVNIPVWEVTGDVTGVKLLSELKEVEVRHVDDRVGMVTPRVICMIINEAFYTLQEGTASREDIDLGMKQGTGYPYGPFEWSERIGIRHVYELLEAIWEDTHEERYKICPLLKKEYMKLKLT